MHLAKIALSAGLAMVATTGCNAVLAPLQRTAWDAKPPRTADETIPPVDVAIVGIAAPFYDSADLTVKAGTTVIFTNKDFVAHTATAADKTFDSGLLAKGQTWQKTFDTPGTYNYICTPHPWMKARIIVTPP